MFHVSSFPPSARLAFGGKFQDKGFTIVEVMVAIVILIIGLLAVLQVFPTAFSVERASQMRTQAALLAQEKIESFHPQSYSDIAVGNFIESELDPPFERFSRETNITYVDVNLQETGVDSGLKKIEVIVSWTSALAIGAKNVKVITLIAER